MGYNKTWPCELRFGTHNYCWSQLKHYEVEATIKMASVLYYIKNDTSKAIIILIAWYQMAPGITTPALEYTKTSLFYINSIWMNDFIRLLQKYNIKIKTNENILLQKQRFNNSCVMQDILNTTTSHTNIKGLNDCRLYLGVIFLSEISNIKGTAIITGSLICDKTKLAKSNID